MKLPVEQVEQSNSDQFDADSLISFYLNRDMYLEGKPKPSIQPEIGLDTDALGEGATGQWTNIGHLSAETLPEFNLEGGDATTRATWSNPQFVEYQVQGNILTSSSLPKDDNGRATGVKIYDAEAFDDSE